MCKLIYETYNQSHINVGRQFMGKRWHVLFLGLGVGRGQGLVLKGGT